MTVTPVIVRFDFDVKALEAALAELSSLLAEVRNRSPETFHRLVGLIEAADELFVVERDRDVTAPANELRIVAKPSEGLAVLVSALRAGNVDLAVIEDALCHRPSSGERADRTPSQGGAS